jgi:peptidoglycan glycosyltransferase
VEVNHGQRGLIYDRNGVVLAGHQNDRRFYTYPSLGQIVGFDSAVYGATGVEATYDDYLSGERLLPPTDVLEARLLSTSPITTTGADLFLTLDIYLQQAAEAALGNRAGAVVLLDPNTGAILALASYPRFNPNTLVLPEPASDADVANVEATWQALSNRVDSPLLNRATQGRYPPGSIIKTLTAAAALDSRVLEFPESSITCPNRLSTEVGAPPVRNAVEGLAGRTGNPSNLRRVYAWSCNTAFAQIGLMLGPDTFSDYAQRFGLGFAADETLAPALQDIPADAGTIANDAAFLQRPAALADTAFGQGQILVTPLDMAQMVAVVANDGRYMRPYIVREARLRGEVVYTAQPEVLRQAISPQAAQRMRSIMKSSVDTGYAAPAAIRGVNIGGKTGTAEVPGGIPHSWFVAIAPVEQPRFAIAVIVERGGEGSQTALPVARQVLLAALR